MNGWSEGYEVDIDYTFGYYQELNPLRVKLVFLNAGLVCPEFGSACELGFGQGVSANIHAAATLTQWSGTDFNPSQASYAQELATICGSGAKLFDDAFADFARRDDLPDFDFIGIHGIWSWISDENRAVVVDFIRRKLKVGGVLYISYNTFPGWAGFTPMRHLMSEHVQVQSAKGQGILDRVDGALAFAEKLMSCKPLYAAANPQIEGKIKALKKKNRQYLAHEYFNRDWLPMHFATMADWLKPAKVSYACSARYIDNIDAINLSDEQRAFLVEIPDATFKQSTRDFIVNQQFRQDYWVKGARRIKPIERAEALRAQRVLLVVNRLDVSLIVKTPQGQSKLHENIYTPVLDLMADHKPRTLGQLEHELKDKGVTSLAMLEEVIVILTGTGSLAVLQDDKSIAKAKVITDKLNAHFVDKARSRDSVNYLASPVTGGGVHINRFDQLFLLAISQGKKQPEEWAQVVWSNLSAQAEGLLKDGKQLETPEENLAYLTEMAKAFAEKTLPILKALQIA